MKKKISIIIPCYNELKNIKLLLKNIIKFKSKEVRFIIINNGSTDQTQKFLESLSKGFLKNFSIEFFKVKKNIGYGHGIKEGIKRTATPLIAWTHSDIESNIYDVIKIYKKHKKNLMFNRVLFKGMRKNRNFLDNFFTQYMSHLANFLLKINVNDINAQPKIFSRELLKNVKKLPNDFSLDLFILLIASKKKVLIKEYPVNFFKRKYGTAKGGGSIIGKLKLSFYIFLSILRFKNDIHNS